MDRFRGAQSFAVFTSKEEPFECCRPQRWRRADLGPNYETVGDLDVFRRGEARSTRVVEGVEELGMKLEEKADATFQLDTRFSL